MQIGPEAKYFISVTWELTPPHRGGFCNYILLCQILLLVVCHAPYVSYRYIIVVLISGPKPSGPESMEIWEKRLVNNVQTICYWTTVREYLLINCRFIRGQRVGHWPLTLNSCNELCPWFFAIGHTNYARWLPVFLKDMAKLPEDHPAVHDAFMEGMCVVQRGDKKCYCGSSRYGSSYTYHKTSACQYIWRVHTYATDALIAKLYDGKYELFRFISKELQSDTADWHYELLTTKIDR